jgi:hypothetical protein
MTVIAIGFCLFVVFLGILGLTAPSRFLDLVRRLTSLQGFYLIAVMRIAFGATLYTSAPTSKAPMIVQIIGVVLVASGIVTPFFSHTRYRKVIEWWSAGGDLYVQIWAACTAVFATLLAYIVIPNSLN